MDLTPQPFSRARVERVIGAVRVALALSSLFAIWIDPNEPARYAGLTYSLHGVYLGYSLLLLAAMWRHDGTGRLPLVTHITDIGVASVFQYLTLGPSSPFFTFSVFTLFAAALRWGWQATLRTAGLVLVTYTAMGVSLSLTMGRTELESSRFFTRVVYLMVVTVVLVSIGQHEARLRDEIRRLARWPRITGGDWSTAVPRILSHSSSIIGAGRATLVWSVEDEPWLYLVSWPSKTPGVDRRAPGDFDPLVPEILTDSTFISASPSGEASSVIVSRLGTLASWRGVPVHSELLPRLGGMGLVSAPFVTEHLTGRVFFAELPDLNADVMPIAEVVGRELGSSLEQLHAYERSQRLAIAEDRLRLGRDLHDGLLQSLTGVRLELQGLARPALDATSDRATDRLLALERALGLEQRELRRFIEDLRPSPEPVAGSLASRLDDVRTRLALEWRAPIAIRVHPETLTVPDACARALPLMVHEAIVNALKHGAPTRVAVDVELADDSLVVVVTDDGRGFSFKGRHGHADLVRANAGPISLRDRVASLGGEMTIESGPAGSRIEMSIPLGVVHA